MVFQLYIQTNIIRYYVNVLNVEEPKTIEVALECLFIILAQGEKYKGSGKNPLVMELKNLGAIDLL
jgi:hypothetical protein